MNRTFRSLEIRNFRLFFGGQMISQTGTWMRRVALALLVLRLTDDGVAVGIVTAFQYLPVLLLGPWAGLLADRTNKRRLLFVVQTGLMVQSFVLVALALADEPPLLAFYAIALLGGIGTALDNPVRKAFVVEIVPDSHVQNAVSINTALMTLSRVVGPALAGLLIGTVGFAWCFMLDGLSYLAVLAGLWRLNPSELRQAQRLARGRGQVREGVRYVRGVPALSVSLVMMAIIGTFAYNFQVVLPLFVMRSLDGSQGDFTAVFSVLSVGSMAGALWTARRTTVDLSDLVFAAISFGAGMLILAVMPTLAAAFLAALVVGFVSVIFMTSSTALVQLRADPGMRGRVLSLHGMLFIGSTPIGSLILGWISEAHGARVGVALGGLMCLVAAAYGAHAVHRAATRTTAVDVSGLASAVQTPSDGPGASPYSGRLA